MSSFRSNAGFVLGASILFLSAAGAKASFILETADGSPYETGMFTSLRVDAASNPHVTYFDDTFDRLLYSRRVGGAWVQEVADGLAIGQQVGQYTSLTLDGDGNPHVSYFHEASAYELKYGRRVAGSWLTETVDGSTAHVGQFSSLALDASGGPHITYSQQLPLPGLIKYAQKSDGVWAIEVLDSLGRGRSSLAVDAQGEPHVCYNRFNTGTGVLHYARRTGGTWVIESIEGSPSERYVSLALDAQGNPHVAAQFQLAMVRYATKSAGMWTVEFVGPFTGTAGWYVSLALDPEGRPQIAHQDNGSDNLLYARRTEGAWLMETADGSAGDVGSHASIDVDPLGNPHICYYEGDTLDDLKYATTVLAVSVGSSPPALRRLAIAPNPVGPRGGRIFFDRLDEPGVTGVEVEDLTIYDSSGRRVQVLVAGGAPNAVEGLRWNGRDMAGRLVSPGVYLLRLRTRAGEVSSTRFSAIR